MKKTITILILVGLLITGCSKTPSDSSISTAIAQTQSSYTPTPTKTPVPTNTPIPTSTLIPTNTPVPTSTPTVTMALATSCTPEHLTLIDIDPGTGHGVFVNVVCSDLDPDSISYIMVIVPIGTPSSMIDEALQYVSQIAINGGWNTNDVITVYEIATSDCPSGQVTSGNIMAICTVGGDSTITGILEIP
jgi:hypothetical protein